jgi:hypothetical protein
MACTELSDEGVYENADGVAKAARGGEIDEGHDRYDEPSATLVRNPHNC